MIRYFLLLGLIAGLICAQGPSNQVLVAGGSTRLVHGESIRVTAVSRDAQGQVRPGDTFVWAASDANILSVDAQGNVTAKGLGTAQVFANAGNVRGSLMLQVVPSSIAVTPGEHIMETGDAMQFRARVLDSKGNEIPNTTVTWDIVNMRLGTTVAASIGRQGNAGASGAGRFFVRARYNYAGQTSPFVPYVEGIATLDVRLRTSHAVRELTGTDALSQATVLRPRRTLVSANSRGQIAFQGSLGGIANGIFVWENGTLRTLSTTGAPGPTPTGFVYEFQNFALNDRGDVLSRALVAGSSHGLLVATKDESNWYGSEGMYLGAIEAVSSFYVTRCSLSNDGDAVVRATYRLNGETVTNTGLFRFRQNGSVDLIASTADGLPGTRGALIFENDFGVTGDGTVYFRISTPTDNAIYRQSGWDAPVRVVGIGDTVGAQRVINLPGSTYLNFLVSPEGDLVTLATLANNTTVLLHYPKGAATPRQTTYRSLYGVFAARDGSVLWYGDAGKG
ncbi:MAG: hypothetical protein SGI92_17880, partial [Bryobacteraceae bacterium]|nr:hypothetical protein [Bryobacteraceae bacterium]